MAAPTCRGILFVLTLLIVIQKDGVAPSGQRNPREEAFRGPCKEGISCENGGYCTVWWPDRCVCQKGFKGDKCQTAILPCHNFKCYHFGTCIMKGKKPKCRCVSGFFGKRCEKATKCTYVECQNGGTCKVGPKYAKCHCRGGFKGKFCQKRKKFYSKCAKVRCRNGGVCMVKKNKRMCTCRGPFHGKYCEIRKRLSACDRLRCVNGGTCKVDGKKAKCECPPDHYGKRCHRRNRNVNETCESFKCYNGAECKMVKSRPKCLCPPAFDGNACKIRVEYGIHPSMNGDGYIRFSKQRLDVDRFTLKIVFRPLEPDGLLLYTSNLRSYFFSVTLERHRVLLRSNSGSGLSELIPLNIVHLQEWNTLTIIRKNGETQARLNYGDVVSGPDRAGKAVWYDIIYLGGYPKFRHIARKVRSDEGLYGCIKEIQINNVQIVFSLQQQQNAYVPSWNSYEPTLSHFQNKWKEFVKSFNYVMVGRRLGPCKTSCFDTTCLNGGECIEKIGYFKNPKCICLPGYSGATCKKYSPVEIPHFSSNSSLEISVPTITGDDNKLRVIMKTLTFDGHILYVSHTLASGRGFISLALEDGYVVLKIVTGRKNHQVKSPNRVIPNKWTFVETKLYSSIGHLKVSGQALHNFDGLGEDTNIHHTLRGNSYLGRDPFIDGSELDEAQRSFTGCVQLVEINGESIDISGRGVSGINVANCSMCDRLNEPCRGGQCIPGENSSYACRCREPTSKGDCKDGHSLHFTGRNYLRYIDQEVLGKPSNDIQLEIRTTCPNGLIFWTGIIDEQVPDLWWGVKDFMALGFEDGVLRLHYDLGFGEAQMNYNESRLFDGNWHFIKVVRKGKYATLVIDHNKYLEGIARSGETLDTYFFYLGHLRTEMLFLDQNIPARRLDYILIRHDLNNNVYYVVLTNISFSYHGAKKCRWSTASKKIIHLCKGEHHSTK
ncbi:pikachurin [Plakobranchus ocellatus]|uniref:Pikachurin n=1 Tax=Plakobranchus ocellatus TaxID=259542 RepID=A0AAV4CZ84_9GAST|nr:pikachurin [Plakobranchus ocellatus]